VRYPDHLAGFGGVSRRKRVERASNRRRKWRKQGEGEELERNRLKDMRSE